MEHNFRKPNYSPTRSTVEKTLLNSTVADTPSKSSSDLDLLLPRYKGSRTAISPNFDSLPDSAFVRLPTLLLIFGCSRASIWRWVNAQRLPAPRKLGFRITAWNVGELRQAIAAYLRGEEA